MTPPSRAPDTPRAPDARSDWLLPRPAAARYGTTAMVLHWLLAAAILGLFGLGVYIANIPRSPLRLELIAGHQAVGLAFLALTVVRAAWRLTHRPPALPASIADAMPAWQHRAHRATHRALYAMFFLVPLLGWFYSSAAGVHIVLFGVLHVPDLVPADRALAERLIHLHGPSGLVLMALVVVHVAAALKHHWLDRDGLIRRMLPWRGW